MNRINNFINQETILTPAKTAILFGGVAISMFSPISIYNTWGAINQNAFRAVFLANLLKSKKPDSAFSTLVSKSNLVTIPYFFGLTAYSIYSSAQIPKLVTVVGTLREKLLSSAQVMEALESVRANLPSSAQVMETVGNMREKLSSQLADTLKSVREKLPSNITEKAHEIQERLYAECNKASLAQFYQFANENKSYILIGTIASVAAVSIITYCACRRRKGAD